MTETFCVSFDARLLGRDTNASGAHVVENVSN